MATRYRVRQGDCISSIAVGFGIDPETLWNDGANAKLKSQRREPNVLYPGDVVTIPDLRKRVESAATEAKHRFRRKGMTETIEIQLIDGDDAPLADEPYALQVDGKSSRGTTALGARRPLNDGSEYSRVFTGRKSRNTEPIRG